MIVTLPNDFRARRYQRNAMAFFDGGGKRAITVWHRRAGKDLTALHQTAKSAHRDIGPYWHFFPTFEQARRSIWEGFTKDGKRILECAFPGFLDPKRPGSIVKRTNESQMFVEFHAGSIWRLMGSDRVESVGAGPKGTVFSEYALCRPRAWDYVRPMLRESGGWAWFITTPRGKNHAKKMYDAAGAGSGWYRDIQTVMDTNLTYASNRDPTRKIGWQEMMDEERAEGMPEAMVQQEYACDFTAALVGSVWGDLLEKLEKSGGLEAFDHQGDGVFVNWDLGIGDTCALWFWRIRGETVDLVDFYQSNGKPLSHYLDEVDKRKYEVVKHWFPHDSKQRSFQTGVATLDQATAHLGGDKVALVPSMSIADGIQAARWLLQKSPRFHPRCDEGIEALKAYHYAYDEDKKTFSSKPEHDWSSHAADAFRYVALVAKFSDLITRPPSKPDLTFKPTRPTLDDFDDYEPRRDRI